MTARDRRESTGSVSATAVAPSPPAGATVKVRLSGTRRGCAEAAARLHQVFYVVSVSQPYPEAGSSRLVRVYVRARLDLRPEPPPAAPTGGPQ
jgi:hypothetical protein